MNSFSNLAIRIGICFGLLSLSAYFFKFAAADFYYEQANHQFKSLDIENVRETSSLTQIYDYINESLAWRPNDSEALDLKANILYAHWWISPDGQYYQDSSLLQHANKFHLASLEVREVWSFGFARLALIHSQKALLDPQFESWFSRAYEVGRYETSIARSLMQVGLMNWNQLNEDQQNMTIEFIRLSIEQKANSPRFMKGVLQSYGKLEFVCSQLEYTERKDNVCY